MPAHKYTSEVSSKPDRTPAQSLPSTAEPDSHTREFGMHTDPPDSTVNETAFGRATLGGDQPAPTTEPLRGSHLKATRRRQTHSSMFAEHGRHQNSALFGLAARPGSKPHASRAHSPGVWFEATTRERPKQRTRYSRVSLSGFAGYRSLSPQLLAMATRSTSSSASPRTSSTASPTRRARRCIRCCRTRHPCPAVTVQRTRLIACRCGQRQLIAR
jgi:hypothetical protein